MGDVSLPWGGDLSVDETGDISVVNGINETIQRTVRRLLTSPYQAASQNLPPTPPDYIFDNSYGVGARLYVDRRANQETLNTLQQRAFQACSQEPNVSTTTPPVVVVAYNSGSLTITGTITDSTGQQATLPLIEVS